MELMMCGGLFTITYENSAESIPPLLFGQSKGTSQNCTKLCPIKTRPTLSIKHKLSPVITQLRRRRLRFLTHAIFFPLWMREWEESANTILCTRCVTIEHTGVSIFLSLSFSHWQAVTCWLPLRSFPVRAGARAKASGGSVASASPLRRNLATNVTAEQNSCCLRDKPNPFCLFELW